MTKTITLFFWRLRAAAIVVGQGFGLRSAWLYAEALSEGDSDYFADGYSPGDAIREDHSYSY